jgi:hypothetical protein
MARKATIDWEAYKEQLLIMRGEGNTLNMIAATLYDKLGHTVTSARLSQVFSGWARQFNADLAEKEQLRKEIGTDAN